ncbi:MAG: BphX family protein [Acidimicrobiales bacterium]
MNKLTWWLRIVGVFYLLQSVGMALVKAPIRTFGPEGALSRADAGDPIATFLVDTWFTFGLEVGAIGLALLVASRYLQLAPGVAWTVLAIEVTRGILNDVYMIARGIEVPGYLVWIVIHSVVIATGLQALRAAGHGTFAQPGPARSAVRSAETAV